MSDNLHHSAIGRGAQMNPANRFDTFQCEDDTEQLSHDDLESGPRKLATEYLPDDSRSIVSENQSPDLDFRFSLNPYRGCAHGCSYCYARPYHEFLGMSAGLDFETKLLIKHRAPQLFREWLDRPQWQCELITLSGVTDCYQAAEREFRLTRACLEIALASRQPIGIVTKNALVTRDLDLLAAMARQRLVHVSISITTLDQHLTRTMEPRTSSPAARLAAIERLSDAGVPTRALLSPIIPGLNDFEIPQLLQAVSQAGAVAAGFTMLRLPESVQPIFLDWLNRCVPAKKDLIESRIRQVRGGNLNDSRFGSRMSGQGVMAKQIRDTFRLFARKYNLHGELAEVDTSNFCRPSDHGQRRLF